MSIQFCSTLSAARNEALTGTAPAHQRYLFAEIPAPWPYHAIESANVPPELRQALHNLKEAETPIRLQAFYSEEMSSPEHMRRFFYFTLPKPPYAAYRKREYLVPESECPAFVQTIAAADEEQLMNTFETYRVIETEHVAEWFVCTHGSHDFCCGRIGAPVYIEMKDRFGSSDGNFRVWRTDHMGGHRFAPTAMEFSSGRFWGRLESEVLDLIVERKGEFAPLLSYYRGWSGIGKLEQLAEAELMKRFGWKAIHWQKQASIIMQNEEKAVVHIIVYAGAENEQLIYEAEIERDEPVEVFGCSGSQSMVEKYKLVRLEQRNANAS